VKILGQGELTKKLSVTAHAFSASAREKIEKAGGSVTLLRGEPVPKKKKKHAAKPKPEAAEAEPEATEAEAEAPEPVEEADV
jgi:large subunit ribosomal protein L15